MIMSKKQRVITVISSLNSATELPIMKEISEKGWIVSQISTSSFDANTLKGQSHTKPSLAVTLLLEKEE
jgi:hypothetical protein